ncbi:MAG: molybdopterin converting factor subunit 1 [Alphaproteobacteria bacterium]|nr:molybdopterin converting factor subunit 1 [Alphaproteobacteria bacterium]
MRILYFAWVRERAGAAEETVSPPAGLTTVGQLADWLATRSPGHAAAFADRRRLRVAINQEQARFDDPVGPGDEVAFFPPMTGG